MDPYSIVDGGASIIPVAFSLMASFMSAITLLGVTQENYTYGTQVSLCIDSQDSFKVIFLSLCWSTFLMSSVRPLLRMFFSLFSMASSQQVFTSKQIANFARLFDFWIQVFGKKIWVPYKSAGLPGVYSANGPLYGYSAVCPCSCTFCCDRTTFWGSVIFAWILFIVHIVTNFIVTT